MPQYWLMKTEPDVFSFEDLCRAPRMTTSWDGVRNYQARNFMRDEFRVGDQVLIYHSRLTEPAIVGIALVVRAAHPDPTALNPQSKYYDSQSAKQVRSRWVMVDVQAQHRLAQPFTLARCRREAPLRDMALIRPGQRLSIQKVSTQEWEYIISQSQLEPVS